MTPKKSVLPRKTPQEPTVEKNVLQKNLRAAKRTSRLGPCAAMMSTP